MFPRFAELHPLGKEIHSLYLMTSFNHDNNTQQPNSPDCLPGMPKTISFSSSKAILTPAAEVVTPQPPDRHSEIGTTP